MMMEWSCFCFDPSSQTDLSCWCSAREIVYVQQGNTKAQLIVSGQVLDVRGYLPPSHWQCTMPTSMPTFLLLYEYVLSPQFVFLCFPIHYGLPSRSQTSLRNASAPLVSHGFMLWGQNALIPRPSLFTASLLAGLFLWRGKLQSEKSSHWRGMLYSQVRGAKPLIQSFSMCSMFWFGISMALEIEYYAYSILK